MKNKCSVAFVVCLLSVLFFDLGVMAEVKEKDIIAQYTFDQGTKAPRLLS